MRVMVMGAGAIGGFVAGAWRHAGADVALLGRPRQAVAHAAGVTLADRTDTAGWTAQVPVPFHDDPAVLADADLVVLAVKCTAIDTAAAEIADHARPGVPILSLLNGPRAAEALSQRLPDNPVLPGMVAFNVVGEDARWTKTSLGHVTALRHAALAPLPSDGPAAVEQVADMEPVLWGKLLLNLNNAVNALSALGLRDELSRKGYRRVLAAAMREALEACEAAGIRPAKVGAMAPRLIPSFLSMPDILFRPIGLRLQKIDPAARSSMAEDFAAGKPTEVDWLNGAVVDLAQSQGIEAPVNARLTALVHDAEEGGRRDWPAPDLVRAVLRGR
ncbi:2-dehydropantoate 2-reductase [Roseobacter sp. HKCCA0434]|uniref:2-dehydropantoate 2-reductase n=1 Tax=Roseobacter sp. HKCCA0434 TaxID=3079297 RepID=UPI0029059AA7|nr:2-dehydropantoate 2-reductase [Roseobacter sp. HKCCA0434]